MASPVTLHRSNLETEGQNLTGTAWWFYKETGSAAITAREPGEKPLLGCAASYLGTQSLCISSSMNNCCLHSSSYWQRSLWKRGLEAVGKIQLLSQMFPAQHKRAPGFPACSGEKVYLTLLFFISKQHVARPLPASSHREEE